MARDLGCTTAFRLWRAGLDKRTVAVMAAARVHDKDKRDRSRAALAHAAARLVAMGAGPMAMTAHETGLTRLACLVAAQASPGLAKLAGQIAWSWPLVCAQSVANALRETEQARKGRMAYLDRGFAALLTAGLPMTSRARTMMLDDALYFGLHTSARLLSAADMPLNLIDIDAPPMLVLRAAHHKDPCVLANIMRAATGWPEEQRLRALCHALLHAVQFRRHEEAAARLMAQGTFAWRWPPLAARASDGPMTRLAKASGDSAHARLAALSRSRQWLAGQATGPDPRNPKRKASAQ